MVTIRKRYACHHGMNHLSGSRGSPEARRAGAEVDKATPFGTPLSNAMENGHEKCAALLRAAGAKDVR